MGGDVPGVGERTELAGELKAVVLATVPSTASCDADETVRKRLENRRNACMAFGAGLLRPLEMGTGIAVADM